MSGSVALQTLKDIAMSKSFEHYQEVLFFKAIFLFFLSSLSLDFRRSIVLLCQRIPPPAAGFSNLGTFPTRQIVLPNT